MGLRELNANATQVSKASIATRNSALMTAMAMAFALLMASVFVRSSTLAKRAASCFARAPKTMDAVVLAMATAATAHASVRVLTMASSALSAAAPWIAVAVANVLM